MTRFMKTWLINSTYSPFLPITSELQTRKKTQKDNIVEEKNIYIPLNFYARLLWAPFRLSRGDKGTYESRHI